MIGILNINKPRGVSSSFVVVKLKKLLNTKKVGHMGTLDPLAQGVLPICVGKATRLFDYFLKKTKTYIATFQFGYQTSTLDLEGEVEQKTDVFPTKPQLENAINQMLGKNMQVPPMYSSKKVGGKKAYDLIRSGNQVNLQPCEVEIFKFNLISQISHDTFEFEITCSAGTYIRSIARDLAQKVGSFATMTKLVRTQSGNFSIENALDFENLDKLKREELISKIIPLNEVLKDYQAISISKQMLKDFLDGKKVYLKSVLAINQIDNKYIEQINENSVFKIVCENEIVGLAKFYDEIVKIKTYFI